MRKRRFREDAPQFASRLEMGHTRRLVAPKGTGALLSCALSPHDGGASLAVGGENAAALVFDLRGAHLVAHRLTAAAGCFDREDAVPCVSFNLAAPHALYCASGRAVTAWDVRRLPVATDARLVDGVAGAAKSASIDAQKKRDAASARGALATYAHNADEINHFAIDRDGAFLYAADDACEVAVVELEPRRLDGAAESGGRLAKTLRRDGHENFVSCVALRAHKPREVVSGGLDARVCVWDRDKNAAVRRWDVPELIAAFDRASAERAEMGKKKRAGEEEASEDPARGIPRCETMNPPFVHCVATWACARDPARRDALRLAAAACGDGTVALVDLDADAKRKKKTKKQASRGSDAPPLDGAPAVFLGRGAGGGAHASATSHVAFPGWGDGELVVSGGNDRAIKAWRWRDERARLFSTTEREDDGASQTSVAHGRKTNWITHAATREACPGGGHVFVADTSQTVAVYDANAFA